MDVVMPKMGESVSEGTIIKWHKKKGDSVKRDEIIFEISTDKVDTEIPSPADGVLSEIMADEGDTVDVGTVVARISENGESTQAESKVEVKEDSKKDEQKDKEIQPKQNQEESEEETIELETRESADGDLVEIAMPKMGESVMEGTIIKWYKKVGDKVKKDEVLFEISTDKVDTEVPSPEEGTIAEILVGEQETVEVGTVVAKLSMSGKVSQKPKSEKQTPQKEDKKTEPTPSKKEPASMHDNFKGAEVSRSDEGESGMVGFYSPLVLSIANKEKVGLDELKSIKGSGLNGRVTKNDILNYIDQRDKGHIKQKKAPSQEEVKGVPAPSFAPSALKPSYSSNDIEKIPMDNIRQKIMEHMIASKETSVHVAAMLEVDMTKIHNFIHAKREEYQKIEGVKLTYMPFIANACVKALREFPLINSMIEDNTIIRKKFINLGIAVALEPTGLIVPNIKAADERNIIGLAKAINDLAYRARNKKLSPDDISDGTFTITNYGVFGTIFGTPIINQPEVAILGVGTVVKKPVVVEVDGSDTIAIKPVMALTLSHDHRLVDGMLGGKFLKYIKDTLESFDPNSL